MHHTNGRHVGGDELMEEFFSQHRWILEGVVEAEFLDAHEVQVRVVLVKLVKVELEGLLDGRNTEGRVALHPNTTRIDHRVATLEAARKIGILRIARVRVVERVIPVRIVEPDPNLLNDRVIEKRIRIVGRRWRGTPERHHGREQRTTSNQSTHWVSPSIGLASPEPSLALTVSPTHRNTPIVSLQSLRSHRKNTPEKPPPQAFGDSATPAGLPRLGSQEF